MTAVVLRAALVCSLLPVFVACGTIQRDFDPVDLPAVERPESDDQYPNWSIPPAMLERWALTETMSDRAAELEIRAFSGAGAGVTGAAKANVYSVSLDVDAKIKWKPVPSSLDGPNNSPRREVGAYAVQKLFLDPPDYVVPTSVFRCVPLERLRKWKPRATATLDGTDCELGLMSLWMSDVEPPDVLYDEARFLSDPVYAYYMSNFNLLTYLIGHKDGRGGNFLRSKNPDRPQLFAVDNGVAFDIGVGGIWFNWFVPNWNLIRVPALRAESIDRLREVERSDLDALGVLAELDLHDDGLLQPAVPSRNLDPSRGARRDGRIVQFGLKKSEIDDIWERIEDLLEAVDEGDVSVF